jgi:hypothetical protein
MEHLTTKRSNPGLVCVLLVAFPLVLALGGCDKPSLGSSEEEVEESPEKSTGPKKDPPKGDWEDDIIGAKLTFDDKKEVVEVRLTGKRGKMVLSATARDFPKGSKLESGGRKTTVDTIYGNLDVPLDDFRLGEVALADAQDNDATVKTSAKLSVAWPDTKPLEVDVPALKVRIAVADAIKEIAKAPVSFAGEPEGDGKVDTIVWLDINGSIDEVVGSGKVLQDVDLIATSEHIDTGRFKKCTGYKEGDVQLEAIEKKVVAYDRRTGNPVSDKTFQPKDRCPSFVMVSADGKGKNYVDEADVVAWLKTLMK